MKFLLTSCLLVVHLELTYSQVDSLADVFPLEVGMRSVYGFYYHISYIGPVTDIVDTGLIEFIVVDSAGYQDSIRWILTEVRDYTHTSNHEPLSPYWVRDTFRIEILELLHDNHLLMSNPPGYTTGFELVPLGYSLADSLGFHRYQNVDSAGRGTWSTTDSGGATYDVVVLENIGIVQSTGGVSFGYFDTLTWRYFRKTDSTVLGTETPPPVPRQAMLYQNYPNPFNPITLIRYEVPEAGFVRLIIYDLLGTPVATLVDEPRLPGSYEVLYDGGIFSTGVYIYRLEVGGKNQTKKCLLIK